MTGPHPDPERPRRDRPARRGQADGQLLAETESLCPRCLRRIPAARVAYGEDVYLRKACPDHGAWSTVI
ncbi:MAG TPA: hypothetical protein VFP72_22380, partial [Kineosporiaceae bacterium]|nr:hypothetical protein [Kineosporiaceae bacterium]